MLRQELEEEEEEEFQEADILWPDAVQDLDLAKMFCSHESGDDKDDDSGEHRTTKLHNGPKTSSPIDIPGPGKPSRATRAKAQTLAGFSRFSASRAGAGGSSSLLIGSHVFMPPHVILDRRAKRDTAILMVVDVPKGRRVRAMVMLE